MESITEKVHQKAKNLLNKLGRPDHEYEYNQESETGGDAIGERDIYKFRRQRGVNIGK